MVFPYARPSLECPSRPNKRTTRWLGVFVPTYDLLIRSEGNTRAEGHRLIRGRVLREGGYSDLYLSGYDWETPNRPLKFGT